LASQLTKIARQKTTDNSYEEAKNVEYVE